MKKLFSLLFIILILTTMSMATEILDSLLLELEKTSGKNKIPILLSISNIYEMGDVDKGLSYATQALDIAREIDDQDLIISSNINIGQLHIRLGNYDTAEELLLESEKYLKKNKKYHNLSTVYTNLGLLYREKGDLDNSLDYYNKALQLKSKEEDPYGYSTCLGGIGLVYFDRGEYEKAKEIFFESIEVGEKSKGKKPILYAYNSLGLIYRQNGEYNKALEYYTKVLKTSRELGLDLLVASAYNNIANIHYMIGEKDLAIQDLHEALTIYQNIESKVNIARTLSNLSILAQEDEDWEKAIDLLEQALQMRLELGNRFEIANSYHNIASLYEKIKNYTRAIAYYEEAYRLYQEADNKQYPVIMISNIGYLYLMMQEYELALETLNQAYKLSKEQNHISSLSTITSYIATIYEIKEDYKSAYTYLKEHSTIKDSLNLLASTEQRNELRVHYETEKKEQENQILTQSLAISQLEKKQLTFILIGTFILLGIIIYYFISRVKINHKLKLVNKDLEIAIENANQVREQIALVNKIMRHDLTNSFVVIKSALELYDESGEENMLKEAAKRCDTSLDLIKQMRTLEIGKKDAGEHTSIDIKQLIKKITKDITEPKISITGNSHVLADEALESVFLNLIDNARQHCQASQITISIDESLEFVSITLSNNGRAIAPELEDRIFEEGITSGLEGHTGMGLFLVRQNINRYGGSILLTKNKEHNVTFKINLKKAPTG